MARGWTVLCGEIGKSGVSVVLGLCMGGGDVLTQPLGLSALKALSATQEVRTVNKVVTVNKAQECVRTMEE